MKRLLYVSAAVALLLGGVGQVKAGTIYSNLSADSYTPTGGWTVSGSSGPYGATGEGAEFRADSTGNLGQLNIALWNVGFDPSAGGVTLQLRTVDSNSGGPGSLLESWNVSATYDYGGFQSNIPVASVDSLAHPLLTQGNSYWLLALASSSNTSVGWDTGNTQHKVGTRDVINSSYGGVYLDSPLAGFSLTSTASATPEPASLTLLGLGTLSLAGYGCRRRRLSAAA